MNDLAQVVLEPLEAAEARKERRLAVGKFELIFD